MKRITDISVSIFFTALLAISVTSPLYSADDPLANQLLIEKQQFEPGSFEDPGACIACHGVPSSVMTGAFQPRGVIPRFMPLNCLGLGPIVLLCV